MRTLVSAIAIAAVLAAAIAAGLWLRPGGPSPEKLAHLLQPRITTLPATAVLQVTAKGDPNAVAGRAFGLLFKTYFRIPGVPRMGPGVPAPRARWPVPEGQPRTEWVGTYALPVPATVTALPAGAEAGGLRVELSRWEYGEVAEILHVGAYSEEAPTIERLNRFIEQSHHAVAGEHEEEYVKGPGLFGRGDPRRYLTIIRRRVRPVATPAAGTPQVPEAALSR